MCFRSIFYWVPFLDNDLKGRHQVIGKKSEYRMYLISSFQIFCRDYYVFYAFFVDDLKICIQISCCINNRFNSLLLASGQNCYKYR